MTDVEEILLERIDDANETLSNYSADTEEHSRAAKNLQIYTDQLRQLKESEARIEIEDRNQSLAEVKQKVDIANEEKSQRSRKLDKVWDVVGKLGFLAFGGAIDFLLMHYVYNEEVIEGKLGDNKKLSKIGFRNKAKL